MILGGIFDRRTCFHSVPQGPDQAAQNQSHAQAKEETEMPFLSQRLGASELYRVLSIKIHAQNSSCEKVFCPQFFKKNAIKIKFLTKKQFFERKTGFLMKIAHRSGFFRIYQVLFQRLKQKKGGEPERNFLFILLKRGKTAKA